MQPTWFNGSSTSTRVNLLLVIAALLLAACSPVLNLSAASLSPTPTLLLSVTPTLTATSTPRPRNPACASGHHDVEITVAGEIRHTLLHVPPQLAGGAKHALVINLHGYGGQPTGLENGSHTSEVADKHGFIIAYPAAEGNPSAWDLNPGKTKDVDFIGKLIDLMIADCGVDPARVYLTGHSRGGGMANRLACEMAERIAAIAPVAGAYPFHTECQPSRPVPVMAFHGLKDPTVPFGGRPLTPNVPYATPPIMDWISAWANRNSCNPTFTTNNDEKDVLRESWPECKAEVSLYILSTCGHEWPDTPMVVAEKIWEFFKAH